MSCEVIVKVKTKEKQMTEKTKVYCENLRADFCDDKIDELVAKAVKNFGEERILVKVQVTIKLIED